MGKIKTIAEIRKDVIREATQEPICSNIAPREEIGEFYKKLLENLKTRLAAKGEEMILRESAKQIIGQLCLWYWKSDLFSGNNRKGIMLRGPVGTGKTKIMQACIDTIWQTQMLNLSMIHAFDIQHMYEKSDEKMISFLKKRRLVIIDDVGCESAEVKHFGTSIEPFIDFFDWRYRNGKCTIITTNLAPEEIKAKYGIRTLDRFRESFNDIILEGESFRK
jgi:DNA replication protein DnaC